MENSQGACQRVPHAGRLSAPGERGIILVGPAPHRTWRLLQRSGHSHGSSREMVSPLHSCPLGQLLEPAHMIQLRCLIGQVRIQGR